MTISRQPSCCNRGTTPARTMDDFPDPDGPTTAVKAAVRSFRVKAAASWRRPKNQAASRVSNGRRPTKGSARLAIEVIKAQLPSESSRSSSLRPARRSGGTTASGST